MRGAAAVALAAALAAGCGGSKDATPDRGPLAWVGTPQVFVASSSGDERVLMGQVRNRGLREEMTFDAEKLVVRDAQGREVESQGRFIATYAHGLYGAFQQPSALPESELRRLGLRVRMKPGTDRPLYVAFRLRPGLKPPLRIDYGSGSLPVPEKVRRG